VQSDAWGLAVDRMLDAAGVQSRWACVDLGCGPRGILPQLRERVPFGRVVGVDTSVPALSIAREIAGVEVVHADAFDTRLPSHSFDLVHARFLIAPVGRGPRLLTEMVRLARPGGIIVLAEPDTNSWSVVPRHAACTRLKDLLIQAFRASGGDLDAGRSLRELTRTRLDDVHVRRDVLTLSPGHPYAAFPAAMARSIRDRILQLRLSDASEFDNLLDRCCEVASSSEFRITSFTLVQTWGRTPEQLPTNK
jgi:SAM-dependent methyltransferase